MAKNNEHQFENDIEELMTTELGWTKASERSYLKWREMGLDLERLTDFIKLTQQNAWRSFERSCGNLDVYRKFYQKFEDAVAAQGLIDVLRNGFRINGRKFFVISFRPENKLNQLDNDNYKKNICQLIRQWHYSEKEPAKSVDVVLSVNGIPLAAIELKNQNCGQSVVQGKNQWMTDRSPSEIVFKLNHRVLVYFAVDLCEAWMTTRLEGLNTHFLPFNRGSAGAGEDGGAGNPAWTGKGAGPRALTDYLWHDVLAKDSFLDILQKFVNYDKTAKQLIFPRYHQLDVVRKIVIDVRKNGSGKSYLVQHSAGSGKSNSIAWIAYRLASLFNDENKPVFNSVIVVTDRRVLDKQLQNTITSFDEPLLHTMIVDKKLRDVKAVQTLSRVNRTFKNKTDTFILDFVNTEEEIKEAFQPYYQETDLEDEINIDLVFSKLQEILSAGLYDFNDVDRVCKIHFAANAKDGRASQGEVVSALVEVQRKYNELLPKERALYRWQVRSFVRWYNYLCQITRLFDAETAKEHVFLSYLQHLLPADKDEKMKLEDFVTLEYYKLQETFRGSIALEKKKTELPTPEPKRPSVMEQKKDALQKIIDELNAQSDGDFTEQDRVIMEMVIPLLCENPRLKLAAESRMSPRLFPTATWPCCRLRRVGTTRSNPARSGSNTGPSRRATRRCSSRTSRSP